ncbi:MAG: glycosyltransferase [Kofleriaceae bacterium]|nr:glycosyltransferase [Kofleriaceae bacterium]
MACLYEGPAPESAVAYDARNIELVPVPPAGGDSIRRKLDAVRVLPHYARTILRELANADVVHVRAPANIAMVAMLVLRLAPGAKRQWFKYAGNWKPATRDPATYALQRWWLGRGRHGGVVTVNGRWPVQPAYVRTFRNPSLDDTDLERGRRAAQGKQLTSPLRLLFVGALNDSKGAARVLQILALLRRRGVDATLELLGDGPDRGRFEAVAASLEVSEHAHFLGWQSRLSVHAAYERAHFLLLPSATEGWPKVLSEGMAFGVVPLAGDVSAIRGELETFGAGAALPVDDINGFADTLARYITDPARWRIESSRAAAAAPLFSFSNYLASVDELLRDLTRDGLSG